MIRKPKYIGRYRNPETNQPNRIYRFTDEKGNKRFCREVNGQKVVIPGFDFIIWRKSGE